jgi:L-2-hydroxyglutarate oxidase LhgO
MTQDEIIEMAKQVGIRGPVIDFHKKELETFAKLVAEKERERLTDAAMKAAEKAVDLAIALEREACANIVEENANKCGVDTVAWMLLASNAEAIRARRQA